jgi:hypothetical protein
LYNFVQHDDGPALVRRNLVECAKHLAVWYERSSIVISSAIRAGIAAVGRAILGQQPMKAGSTAEACLTAYDLTGEQRYLQLAGGQVVIQQWQRCPR